MLRRGGRERGAAGVDGGFVADVEEQKSGGGSLTPSAGELQVAWWASVLGQKFCTMRTTAGSFRATSSY